MGTTSVGGELQRSGAEAAVCPKNSSCQLVEPHCRSIMKFVLERVRRMFNHESKLARRSLDHSQRCKTLPEGSPQN